MPLVPHAITSLRGGLSERPPATIADDQCEIADNVEWFVSPLGDRRPGALGLNLAGSPLAGCEAILWLHRHLPSASTADAQLWALGRTGGTATLAYRDTTTWNAVTIPDGFVFNGRSEYEVNGQTLHGKLFIAYHSSVDRLHVFDGSTLRRTGLLGVLTAPTVATTGSGTFGTTRYYRVRFLKVVGSTTLRSEPTNAATFVPPGTGSGANVSRPGGAGDGETHWEAEASLNGSDWYRIASTVPLATTFVTDSTPAATGYSAFPLSDDVGDNTPIPSARYLSSDEDRLVCAGSFMSDAIASRVMWTPVFGGTGVGNDERLALDTTPYLDLDNHDGGMVTGLSHNINGYLYAPKWRHIYQLARTGVRTRAYEAIPLTKQRGAMPGSMVEGFDQAGKPFLFALDPDVGPIQIGGAKGIEPCGRDLLKTWKTVNKDAIIPARGVYFPEKLQVHWWVPVSAVANSPNLRIVLHTNLTRQDAEGARGGFALWLGASSVMYAVCMFSDNVETVGPRSRTLKPFLGLPSAPLIVRTDVGDTDWGTAYAARLKTKAFIRSGLLDHFECGEAQFMTNAVAGGTLDVTVSGTRSDQSIVQKIVPVSLTAASGEGDALIHSLDNLSLAELQTIQVDIRDSVVAGPWQLHLLSMTLTGGQKARGAA